MKLSTALRLGRVSNLPTVTSNVLAAVALAGAHPSPATIAGACLAASLMYIAGMWLNDAFDRDIDRVERPERPIPSGEVATRTVFDVGFALLAIGVAAVAVTAWASGAGWKPVASAVMLGSLIVVYDVAHKGHAWSPVIMGLCRAAVYTTAALLVRRDLCSEVIIGCGLLVAYLVGLTHAARFETRAALVRWWPLACLAVPFVVWIPHSPLALVAYGGFALWVVRCVRAIATGDIRSGITGLIAGISLFDALAIAGAGRTDLVAYAVGAFVVTNLLQRVIPGT
jgi:4-hydroxybenzoate polyprenyltransferase